MAFGVFGLELMTWAQKWALMKSVADGLAWLRLHLERLPNCSQLCTLLTKYLYIVILAQIRAGYVLAKTIPTPGNIFSCPKAIGKEVFYHLEVKELPGQWSYLLYNGTLGFA